MINIKRQQGFTLVEALLIVTIFAVVLTASFSLSNSQVFEDDLQSKILQVSELLERARNNSANGYRGDVWGIEVLDSDALCENSGDCILMFKGSSFSGRDTSYDAFVQFDTDVTGVYIDSDQENEFYFAYQSGFLASSTNSSIGDQYIDFNTNSGDKQSLVVSNTGAVRTFVCKEDQVFDQDGNGYNTFGFTYSGVEYCWMAENLNRGTMLADVTDDPDASDGTIEKWCYDDTSSNCDVYGGLYDWNEAMGNVTTEGVQGICPSGWHIPSYTEFLLLGAVNSPTELKIGGNLGFDLFMGGIKFVYTPDYYAYADGGGDDIGFMWTSTISGGSSYAYYIEEDLDVLSNYLDNRNAGLSIRCIKNY